MENKIFLEKYFSEKDRKKQLSLLKNYMLALSPTDLKQFMLEPLIFLEKALNSSDVSAEKKKRIIDRIDEMIFLLKGKVAA